MLTSDFLKAPLDESPAAGFCDERPAALMDWQRGSFDQWGPPDHPSQTIWVLKQR